jgi:tRNA-2-methylthio-N6-dimethylallyladenosine synthase
MDRGRLDRRFPAVDLFLRPDQEPELVDRLGLASAQGPVGLAGSPFGSLGASNGSIGATTLIGRTVVGVADHLAGTRAAAIAGDAVHRQSAVSAWLPIIYGCDKTCTYCIVPFSRGPERSRPFDEIVDEARSIAAGGFREVTLLGQNVNSYGHDLAPEARFGHVRTERWAGRQLDLGSRPDLAELIRAIDALRTADGSQAIPRLRFITSHPWDLSDRLIEAMAECPSVCEALHLPVQSGDDAVLRRMGRQYTIEHYTERLTRIRESVPDIAISTDVIVGFCGETEPQFESTLRLLEDIRYDQVFAAAYSERPGTPATHLADDVPAEVKRRRLNQLLALQEPIGLERNRAWLGRDVDVLVDTIVPPRTHEHDDSDQSVDREAHPPEPAEGSGHLHLSGRTRQNKLVHVTGPAGWLGTTVRVRVEHAGPYALRGAATA